MSRSVRLSFLLAIASPLTVPLLAQSDDPNRAGRFDAGKMWTFEYAPQDYFTETYGFDANPEWFERARMAALRIPGCSASFVSPHGLLATNHHCVRGAVARVSEPGEGLLDHGFYASSLAEERRIPGYYADQLIGIEDISDDVDGAVSGSDDPDQRARAQSETFAAIERRLLDAHRTEGDSVWVQMIALYNGGRHSAYVFRRYTDVRLVMAVELQAGFFGGDPDNFTYPRYALDFAFLRIYDGAGNPLQPSHYFGWGRDGVESGDVVFVVGNPGPTTRLTTVSQLEFLRDVQVPAQEHWYRSRHQVLGRLMAADPERGEALGVRNLMFSLSNSLKATTGRRQALNTPMVMDRRADAERALRDAIAGDPTLQTSYGALFDDMAAIQQGKRGVAPAFGAFYQLANERFGSRTLRRALIAADLLMGRQEGAPSSMLREREETLLQVEDQEYALEAGFLAARLDDIRRYFGPDHALTTTVMTDGTGEATAAAILAHSALASQEGTGRAVETDGLSPDDPAIRIVRAMLPDYRRFVETVGPVEQRERALSADLGRVKFEVYGEAVPPDATFSPRITDGVVMGYAYNGTLAPPYTTFYGMYDRHYAHRGVFDWELPERWRTPPEGLDLGTPLNFVSTADTYGGNSGSPAVTRDLELVGLNFDRNVQGLSRDYIYLPEQGRNVMVDARAIQAALDHVYDADRIVLEFLTGQLFESETEADACVSGGACSLPR